MTTGTVRQRTPGASADLLRAMARPGFLVSRWSLRAIAYTATTVVIGLITMMVATPLYMPWTAVAIALLEPPIGTVGDPSQLVLVLLVGLILIVCFGPLLSLPLAAVERRRLRLVSPRPAESGHRVPPPGLWGWIRVRYTEAATWREVVYLFLLLPLTFLIIVVMGTLVSFTLVLLMGPFLVEDVPGAQISLGPLAATTTEEALPLTLLSPVTLLAAVYLCGVTSYGHGSLARALLVGPPKEELRAELTEVTHSRARLVDAFEYERRRIERDLHDGAQQRLVALNMDLGMARLDVDENSEADRRLAAAQRKADELITELRELVRGIHPRVLTDRGLPAALAELADHSPVPVTVQADLPRRPPSHVEGTAYFVVAEALTNVYKHTEANAATVHAFLAPGAHGDTLVVEVTDYGPGGADPVRGSGLTGMRDRVAVMGGTMDLSSPQGGPTRIRVELPCTIDRTDPR
ncbi:sensor histidine kinase [Nocardiopsis sp. CC223A]|uniref:sensor histidine kinase n=1 Tax=Nocardiopsis sp. CC223A TaxID=3044051 RepID=UPI00278C7F7C|nr:sensor histidine kinase [Nocardiopsis sp. CC223A]